MVKRLEHLRRHSERGITLVEVLFALVILMIITLSVLQLFSMSLMVNMGSAARTDLAYKCQQVAETIRWIYSFEDRDPAVFATLLTGSGVNLVSQMATAVYLPRAAADTGYQFWGPNGANVVDDPAPYTITYRVDPGTGGNRFSVTVTAQPATTGARYIGAVSAAKAVQYAAIIR